MLISTILTDLGWGVKRGACRELPAIRKKRTAAGKEAAVFASFVWVFKGGQAEF